MLSGTKRRTSTAGAQPHRSGVVKCPLPGSFRYRRCSNSTKDAHLKSTGTFEADEHLREMWTAFAPVE